MAKTILITGADGFTGPYVEKAFSEFGYNTVPLVIAKSEERQVEVDLCDYKAVESMVLDLKPDGIIHLAGISFVGHGNTEDFYKVNVIAVTNILDALINTGSNYCKVVLASSANIYGNPNTDRSISEDTLPSPVNHYANSKLSMEFMVRNYFDKLPIVITRPFNYIGPGQNENFLVPKMVKHFKEKQDSIELGNIDVSRDFTDVRDVAQCYLELFNSSAVSEVVNLCSGNVYKLKEILSFLSELTGHEIDIKVNPQFIRTNEIKTLYGNNQKLFELTGFRPQIDIKDTLESMLG